MKAAWRACSSVRSGPVPRLPSLPLATNGDDTVSLPPNWGPDSIRCGCARPDMTLTVRTRSTLRPARRPRPASGLSRRVTLLDPLCRLLLVAAQEQPGDDSHRGAKGHQPEGFSVTLLIE